MPGCSLCLLLLIVVCCLRLLLVACCFVGRLVFILFSLLSSSSKNQERADSLSSQPDMVYGCWRRSRRQAMFFGLLGREE